MAQGQSLSYLDFCDRNFHHIALARAFQAQCEIREIILVTKETIATTRALVAEADRMLAGL